MKTKLFSTLFVIGFLGLATSSCQRESPKTDLATPPTPAAYVYESYSGQPSPCGYQGPGCLPGLRCAPFMPLSFISSNGSTTVDLCGSSPCTTSLPWAVSDFVFGGQDFEGYTFFSFGLQDDWRIDDIYWVYRDCNTIQHDAFGKVMPDANWTYQDYSGLSSPQCTSFQIDSVPDTTCKCLAIKARIVKLTFLGSPLLYSRRTLYLNDSTSAFGPDMMQICNVCANTNRSYNVGSCQGCDSQNNVAFQDCGSVQFSSCKNIAKVKIVYDDCSQQLLHNVGNGTTHTAPAGKQISHIWLKSGCNGPADGRRFDSYCVNSGCN